MFADNQIPTVKWMAAEVVSAVLSIAFFITAACSNNWLAYLIVAVVLAAIFAALLYLNPSYFYFSDESKQFVEVRSVQAFPFFRKPLGWKFPKQTVVKHTMETDTYGLRKFLSITIQGMDPKTRKMVIQSTGKINVSIIKKETLDKIEGALRRCEKMKKF